MAIQQCARVAIKWHYGRDLNHDMAYARIEPWAQ